MTRRRGSGEDSVYRDGDRWRGAVSLGYDEHGNRIRKKVSGRTRAEVTEKLRKLHQQVDSGVVPDDRLTVQAFLDRWLTVNLPGSVAESTEDDYVDTVRLHLVPALGRKRLAKLTVADLDRLWKAKRDAGYSSNSVRIMRTVLRRALGQAVREGIVGRNVAGCPRRRASGPRMAGRSPSTRRGSSWRLRPDTGSRRRSCWPSPTECAAVRCWDCTGQRWTGRPQRWE